MLLWVCFLGTACGSKQEDPAPVPQPTPVPVPTQPKEVKCRIVKQVLDYPDPAESFTREFQYTANRLTKVVDTKKTGSTVPVAYSFEYNSQGQLVKTNFLDNDGKPMFYYTYEHTPSGLLSKIHLHLRLGDYSAPPVIVTTRNMGYNTKNQLTSVKEYLMTGQAPLISRDITYTYDAQGNITNSHEYRVLEYVGAEVKYDVMVDERFTYDNKVNPYRESPFFQYFPFISAPENWSLNNVATMTSGTSSEGTKKGPSTEFNTAQFNFTKTNTFTYTTQNRPENQTADRGPNYSFTYACE
ncbi:hypothetical protein EFB08_07240 [Rufibacter latericius]|uniref:DUF4595 domain-containing protein n=2 Tax=Rufibacter latericius TaxID=2487040 RepID=A0A3M9MVR3_9BACT|nr:hypothetical protein EFB08_07240 [Rufibacter latericius]